MKRHGGNKCTLLSEGSQFERVNNGNFNYMILWKRQNYGDKKKISGCQDWGESNGNE